MLISFDRDGTVSTGGGPVPLDVVRDLACRHDVWAHGNQALCAEAGIPGVEEANRRTGRNVDAEALHAGQDLRRERLRLIGSLFPGARKVCVDDVDLSDLRAEGWEYYAPQEFAARWREVEAQGAAPAPGPDDLLTSRYVRCGDPRVKVVAGVRLPESWWSRPYEYAWAMGFCDPDTVALDAGCGVPHPFKAHLARACREAHACDTDPDAALVAALIPGLRFALASVAELPYGDGTFDRVFCISTLEHLGSDERAAALREFGRVLRPGGLAILTVDVPPVTPRDLLDEAAAAGLRPAGAVTDLDGPPADALYHEGWGLRVYRAALVRA